jgi:hypothetical protein
MTHAIGCCCDDHATILQYLIDQGAVLNIADNDGATQVYISAHKNSPECLALLLQHGADANKLTLMEERRCSSVPRRIATIACLCCYRTALTQTQLTIMEQRRCIGAGSPQARPPRALTALWVRKIRSYLEVLSSILSYLFYSLTPYLSTPPYSLTPSLPPPRTCPPPLPSLTRDRAVRATSGTIQGGGQQRRRRGGKQRRRRRGWQQRRRRRGLNWRC